MSDTVKLIIAFFLGLAVAIGSAFFFMRPAAAPPPAPAVAAAPSVPAIPAPATTPEAGAASTQAFTKPKIVAKAPPKPAKAVRQESAELATPEPLPQSAAPPPASVASNAPPSMPSSPPAGQPVFTPAPAAPAVASQPHTITLQSGTVVNIRLLDTLSSDKNSSGDSFRASLTSPLVVDGFVIADKGSSVSGEVVSADRAGRVKGRAALALALSTINTTDGQQIRIQTDNVDREANASKKADAAKIAVGAGLGALIGGLAGGGKGAAVGAGAGGAAGTGVVLGTRGSAVTIPSETALTFRLTSPVTITEQLHN